MSVNETTAPLNGVGVGVAVAVGVGIGVAVGVAVGFGVGVGVDAGVGVAPKTVRCNNAPLLNPEGSVNVLLPAAALYVPV